MDYFKYGEIETEYLSKRDEKLGVEINKIGMINREVNADTFSSLISSVIG